MVFLTSLSAKTLQLAFRRILQNNNNTFLNLPIQSICQLLQWLCQILTYTFIKYRKWKIQLLNSRGVWQVLMKDKIFHLNFLRLLLKTLFHANYLQQYLLNYLSDRNNITQQFSISYSMRKPSFLCQFSIKDKKNLSCLSQETQLLSAIKLTHRSKVIQETI